MKRFFLLGFLVFVFGLSGCDVPFGDNLQFTVSCDDGLLYICTSIILDQPQENAVIAALADTPAGYGGSTVINVDPHKLWNVRTISDLISIIKSSKGHV